MAECEYPECYESDEDNIRTYGFTINGLIDNERDYCDEHAPGSNVIDP